MSPLLPNHAATFHTFELWPGGRWRFVMHGPDGTDYPNESGHHFFMTITFTVEANKTLVGWRQVFDTATHKERIAKFVSGANEQNLSRLADEVLNVRSPAKRLHRPRAQRSGRNASLQALGDVLSHA